MDIELDDGVPLNREEDSHNTVATVQQNIDQGDRPTQVCFQRTCDSGA